MKKLVQILAAVIMSFSLSVGVASAQSSSTFECGNLSISNGNGTGSTNEIVCENDTDIVIRCSNDIDLVVNNDQDADSGNSSANNNTTVGDVTTGDAENISFVEAKIEAACAAAKQAQTPPTPPTPAPVVPTGSQGGGQGAAPSKKVAVAALPNTGPSTLVNGIAASAAGLGAVASLVHVAIGTYRRRTFKA